jgi:hypothetical protein
MKYLEDKRRPLGEERDWKVVVPKSGRAALLEQHHDDPCAGHLGAFKTTERLRELFYWPGLGSDVIRYVRRCRTCKANKGESQVPAGLMGKEKKARVPWQIVSTDLMGPFPRSTAGHKYILVVTDYLTKYSVLTPLREAKAPQIVKFLEEQIFLIYGAPQYLICDNGRQFVSGELKRKAAEYGCTIWYTASYHPQANPTERVNRVIKAMIASYVKDDQKKWDRQLPKIGFALRTAVHEVTQFTPAYLNFGREPAKSGTQHEMNLGNEDLNQNRLALAERQRGMELLYKDVELRLSEAYEKAKRRYDLRRRPATYVVGDVVWRANKALSNAAMGFSRKLAPNYLRSIVKRVVSTGTYELCDEGGKSLGVWHAKDLKADNHGEL